MVSLNIYKNSANKFGRKTGFKIENEIEDQDQSIPKLIGILTHVFCTFGPNLVILAWTGDELSCRQAQNGVTFDFEVKFDLEGQGQSPPKTIGILTKVFYIYGPNLVILAETGHELSRGQAKGWRTRTDTHTHTDAGNDNTRRPKLASGKNVFENVICEMEAILPRSQCDSYLAIPKLQQLQHWSLGMDK